MLYLSVHLTTAVQIHASSHLHSGQNTLYPSVHLTADALALRTPKLTTFARVPVFNVADAGLISFGATSPGNYFMVQDVRGLLG